MAGWLLHDFTEAFRPAAARSRPLRGRRHPLPNLRAVNFVVHGILGWGVASNLRLDTQAKGLGEFAALALGRGSASSWSGGPPAASLARRLTAGAAGVEPGRLAG